MEHNGAWFTFVWNASASPIATLLLASSSTSNTLSYFLNGVLKAGVSATGNLTITGVTANATNTLKVYLQASNQTSRWNNGTNVVQVLGLQIDGSSSAGTAPSSRPWGIIVGDSITEGIEANNGSGDNLSDYSFLVGQAMDQLGYDTCINACGSSGWFLAGDNAGDVPAWYYTYSGTYTDSLSRWNKIDQGVSILDSSNQISSYGSTGTSPSFILMNLGTNEAHGGNGSSDVRNSIKQSLIALRAAAPNAILAIIIPFGLYNSTVYPSSSTFLTAIKGGFSDYQSAYPADNNILQIDFGATLAATITSGIYTNNDYLHPLAPGHALVAPMIASQLYAKMTNTISTAHRWTHS